MVAQAIDYRRHVRRPVGFVVFGVLLLAVGGYLLYDVSRLRQAEMAVNAYKYTIKQSVDKSVEYFPSSFYEKGPGQNTAYIMGLTDTIKTTFHYKYTGSDTRQLAYAYDVKAVVEGVFSLDGNNENTANVWSKTFQLLEPVHGTVTTGVLSFDPVVSVPYSKYTELVESLRTSLVLPIMSKVTVVFTINVSGNVDGTDFNDLRTSSVSAPIEQQIFTINQKYDKEDTKQVMAPATKSGNEQRAQYELYGAIALGILALGAIVYGLRRQIFKTPYHRELDKIYRYHDGIIVRAAKPADLSGKNVVPVRTFEDMLNLEEELKSPIVSSPAGTEATRFSIMHRDVAYVYTLGTIPHRIETPLEQIQATVSQRIVEKPKAKPRKIQ